MKMKRVVMVSLGVMTTVLILLVTAIVGVLVLLGEHAAEGVEVVAVVKEGVEGAEGVEVVARDDVEELKLQKKNLTVHELSEMDLNVPIGHKFTPLRSVGPHLPSCIKVSSPAELFKLYFDLDIVQKICDTTNEYAKLKKGKHPVMYQYFSPMTPDYFYALVGIFVHLGYRKIPRYRLM